MEIKKITLFLLFLLCMGLMLGACSDKKFGAREGSVYQQCVDVRPEVKCQVDCSNGVCIETYDYTITTEAQVKDILFVVDVSGSMSEEQKRMGQMFPNFLNILSEVNYRVAITTSDVRDASDIRNDQNMPDEANGFGAWQNGNLIPFALSGKPFLDGTSPLAQEQDDFEETITWEQTLICETKGSRYEDANCPSGDERGILAAARTLENNPENFIRPVGHMALVILSDEDEGSIGTIAEPEWEEPENFVTKFKELYPNKSLSVHSIIVEPKELVPNKEIENNGETVCYNDQDRPGHPPGQYGYIYSELSALTEGEIGDICANNANYSDQLKAIGASVSQVREVLPCRPIGDQVSVNFIPDPGYQVDVIKNFSQNEITFSEPLPKGTQVRFQFKCEDV